MNLETERSSQRGKETNVDVFARSVESDKDALKFVTQTKHESHRVKVEGTKLARLSLEVCMVCHAARVWGGVWVDGGGCVDGCTSSR